MGTTTEELKKLYSKLGGKDSNIPKVSTPGEVLNGINELDLSGTKIDDDSTSTDATWSSTKINSEISSHIGTEYSTSEKSIGKWVDGRTVYRKIISVNSTWLNIGTTSNQSIVYQEDWVKSIDFITNATAVSSEEFYASKFDLAAQVDKGNGSIAGYWNNPFGGSFDRMYVSYVILEYVKASS